MGLYDFTFYDLIQRNAVAFGSRVCWQEIDDGRLLTFAEYKIQVDSLARGLMGAGIEKGDRIGVIGKNSLEFFLLYGAAAKVGGIVLPINWRLSSEEVCYNLNDCQPKIAFADPEFQNILKEKGDDLTSLDKWYNLKADEGDGNTFSSLLLQAGEAEEVKPEEVAGGDGFVIIHTAAVAGRPRGALLSHANILCADLHFHGAMDFSPQDVNLNLLPLFHVAGLFMVTSTFHAGGSSLNISKFEAKEAAKLIEENGASLLFDFPPILASIVEAAREDDRNLKSLRAVIGLGTPEVIQQYQECSGGDYFVMYGQTETSCLATIGKYKDRPGSAGKVIALGQVELVDEHDKAVDTGEIGEITLKGPMVFKGYWGLAEDNAYTFRDGWHHTGDLGRFDEDGYLFYAGRKAEKELIKPGGENVYPAEVEKVILQHPAVLQTVVIGVPDPKWKEGIKAVCQLKDGQSLNAEELIEFVGARIARFKKPQYVEFVSEFPVTKDGEPDRQAVKDLFGKA